MVPAPGAGTIRVFRQGAKTAKYEGIRRVARISRVEIDERDRDLRQRVRTSRGMVEEPAPRDDGPRVARPVQRIRAQAGNEIRSVTSMIMRASCAERANLARLP